MKVKKLVLIVLVVLIGIPLLLLIIAIALLMIHEKRMENEMKPEAAFLLKISDVSDMKKTGEIGFAEDIDSDYRCYTYAFDGNADYDQVVQEMKKLYTSNNYSITGGKRSPGSETDVTGVYTLKADSGDKSLNVVVRKGYRIDKVIKNINGPVSFAADQNSVAVYGTVCRY